MITDHDRKLLEAMTDQRLVDPAQADLVKRLLAEHDRLQSEVNNLLNKLGLPDTYPTCQFDAVECHPDTCEFEDCEYQGKSKYDEAMELLNQLVNNPFWRGDYCDSGPAKTCRYCGNKVEYSQMKLECANPDCPAVQAREKVKEWRASNGSI